LYAGISEHSVCSIFIGGVSRKNNWDEIIGVFTREKVWFEKSLSQSRGGATGMGHVQVEKQAVEGKDPRCMPEHVREKWRSSELLFLLTPPMRMGQCVPKIRPIKFQHWGITQKK